MLMQPHWKIETIEPVGAAVAKIAVLTQQHHADNVKVNIRKFALQIVPPLGTDTKFLSNNLDRDQA